MDEDLQYVEEARSGDKEAFSFLIEKYQKQIFNFIYQFFRDYHQSLEVTQETFLRAFKFIHTFQSGRKFSTWLYSIAKNLCIDEIKKRSKVNTIPISEAQKRESPDDGTSMLYVHKDPDAEMIKSEDKRALLEAIDKLPVKYKMVITLCYFDGMSYEEISEVVEMPLSTVKVRIFRAKKKLLEYLDGKM